MFISYDNAEIKNEKENATTNQIIIWRVDYQYRNKNNMLEDKWAYICAFTSEQAKNIVYSYNHKVYGFKSEHMQSNAVKDNNIPVSTNGLPVYADKVVIDLFSTAVIDHIVEKNMDGYTNRKKQKEVATAIDKESTFPTRFGNMTKA